MHSNFDGMLFVYVKAWYYIICYLILKNQDLCKKEMIMKKNLMLVLLFGLCVGVSAAFQYSVLSGASNGGADGSFFIRITKGSGSLYVLDRIDTKKILFKNKNLLANNANMTAGKYGYTKDGVQVNAEGSTISNVIVDRIILPDVVQTGYKLGEFSAGDEISIWLTDKAGNKVSSLISDSDDVIAEGDYPASGNDVLGNEYFNLNTTAGGFISFGIYGGERVQGLDPAGKPLPGILVTMLLGGGALGAMGMRKKRIAKA